MKKRRFKRSGKFWAYILKCNDGTFYTGSTNDLKKRVKEHNVGKRGARYTRYKRPVKVVWRKKFKYFKLAFLEEKRIKRLTRKQKKFLISN